MPLRCMQCNVLLISEAQALAHVGHCSVSPTRHLDAAIATLRGKMSANRVARKAQVELEVWASDGTYVITANSRTVETGEGTPEYAHSRGQERAAAARARGLTCQLSTY